MNPLELWLELNALDVESTMMKLRDAGLISDLCSDPADVAEPDATKARDWLAEME